jgi:hypothetical protein
MAARARRGKVPYAKSPPGNLGDEGAERYMWAFLEGSQIVLAIPGLRDLKLNANEARTIGEMLIQAADEAAGHRRNQVEGGDNHGGPEEYSAEG